MNGRLISRTFQDTTGHTDQEWRELTTRFEGSLGRQPQNPRLKLTDRAHLRYQSFEAPRVYGLFRLSGQDWMPYAMRCRDLSEGGAGLYHGNYVRPGTRCYLSFKQMGKGQKLLGRVKHCMWVEDEIHLVGVGFDRPIALSEYLPLIRSDTTPFTFQKEFLPLNAPMPGSKAA